MKPLKIVWAKKAVAQFFKAVEYIYNDSPQHALQVKNDIEEIIESLLKNPEKFPTDKNKNDNVESEYRVFEKHRLRISYRYYNSTIKIIRVRHTSRNPRQH